MLDPRVNPEISAIMDHTTQGSDLKIQRTQKTLLKATLAMATVADEYVAIENKAKKLYRSRSK